MRPDLVMRSTLPVVMAGIVGLYGVITDVAIMLTRTTIAIYLCETDPSSSLIASCS